MHRQSVFNLSIIAAVTKYHELGGVKQYQFITLQFSRLKVLKSKHQQSCISSWRLQERICFLDTPVPRSCLYSLAVAPFLHLQSQQQWVNTFSHHIIPVFTVISFSLISSIFFQFWRLCIYIGPIWLIQYNFLLEILSLVTSLKSLLTCLVT